MEQLISEFKVGDFVVFPPRGAGKIIKEEERQDKTYFTVRLYNSDSPILVPVDNASSLGMRHLSTKESVEEALLDLEDRDHVVPTDWKHRQQENQELLSDGSISSIAKAVNRIYRRAKVKELPMQEKRMYQTALDMLIFEIAHVLKLKKEETKKVIFIHLEKND